MKQRYSNFWSGARLSFFACRLSSTRKQAYAPSTTAREPSTFATVLPARLHPSIDATCHRPATASCCRPRCRDYGCAKWSVGCRTTWIDRSCATRLAHYPARRRRAGPRRRSSPDARQRCPRCARRCLLLFPWMETSLSLHLQHDW